MTNSTSLSPAPALVIDLFSYPSLPRLLSSLGNPGPCTLRDPNGRHELGDSSLSKAAISLFVFSCPFPAFTPLNPDPVFPHP